MTDAEHMLARLDAAFRIRLQDDAILIAPASALTDADRQAIACHRPALLALLRHGPLEVLAELRQFARRLRWDRPTAQFGILDAFLGAAKRQPWRAREYLALLKDWSDGNDDRGSVPENGA